MLSATLSMRFREVQVFSQPVLAVVSSQQAMFSQAVVLALLYICLAELGLWPLKTARQGAFLSRSERPKQQGYWRSIPSGFRSFVPG